MRLVRRIFRRISGHGDRRQLETHMARPEKGQFRGVLVDRILLNKSQNQVVAAHTKRTFFFPSDYKG